MIHRKIYSEDLKKSVVARVNAGSVRASWQENFELVYQRLISELSQKITMLL